MIKDNSNPFPNLLRHYRLKKGFTQKETANAISISRSGYANYEEGRCMPSIEQAMALSELLNHDLLFAYSISVQCMRQNSRKKMRTNALYEKTSYIPDMSSHYETTELFEIYEQLPDYEQKLIKHYIEKRYKEIY